MIPHSQESGQERRRLSCPHGTSRRWLPPGAPLGAVGGRVSAGAQGYALSGVPQLEASEHPRVRASLRSPVLRRERCFRSPGRQGSSRMPRPRWSAARARCEHPSVGRPFRGRSFWAPRPRGRVRASSRAADACDPLFGGSLSAGSEGAFPDALQAL